MKDIRMYCLCLDNHLLSKVKKLNYIPVGLGKANFSSGWLRDNTGDNISNKNPYYGEYSFHYWFWKNELKDLEDNSWIGFCTYRRFWLKENSEEKHGKEIENKILSKMPVDWDNYETILANHVYIDGLKLMKVLKYGKLALIKNPLAIFKKYRNIRFNFDMFHGVGILDKAINLLEEKDREDFRKFTLNNNSFNQCNLFMCKSKILLNNYYEVIFGWFEKLEKVFGFSNDSYEKQRLYGFLAERFLSYWFNKYSKVLEKPIVFYDLNK